MANGFISLIPNSDEKEEWIGIKMEEDSSMDEVDGDQKKPASRPQVLISLQVSHLDMPQCFQSIFGSAEGIVSSTAWVGGNWPKTRHKGTDLV